jgi:hypothetical protein
VDAPIGSLAADRVRAQRHRQCLHVRRRQPSLASRPGDRPAYVHRLRGVRAGSRRETLGRAYPSPRCLDRHIGSPDDDRAISGEISRHHGRARRGPRRAQFRSAVTSELEKQRALSSPRARVRAARGPV